jgi:hypothetical protein
MNIMSSFEAPAPTQIDYIADLCARLRHRAHVESPEGYDQNDAPPDLTWQDMREVSMLLTEASAAIEGMRVFAKAQSGEQG